LAAAGALSGALCVSARRPRAAAMGKQWISLERSEKGGRPEATSEEATRATSEPAEPYGTQEMRRT